MISSMSRRSGLSSKLPWLALFAALLPIGTGRSAAAQQDPFFLCVTELQTVVPGSVLGCQLGGSNVTLAAALIESLRTASVFMVQNGGFQCTLDGFAGQSWVGTLQVSLADSGKVLCIRDVNRPGRPCLQRDINRAQFYCY